MSVDPRIGVLALQGAFARHAEALEEVGAHATEVRGPEDLAGLAGIVVPGGESTTIGMLLRSAGLWSPLRERVSGGLALFGTCAGMILAARGLVDPGPNDREPLGALGITVRRNAFGRQVDSFEADLDVRGVEGGPFHGVFIRAPVIETWDSDVEVLAWQNGRAVMARRGPVLVCAFHPELTQDRRIHDLFVRMAVGEENL
ncbi:MAG: pyridoxal 5'-phosphate synthase glutaminase subunit PdxT [Actinobacteria bacterium ATB1]|nr:pyridoxal 5'-phosphate synthase glutaminase subunit PdxT [Actinobacteria bacterium ATB1]